MTNADINDLETRDYIFKIGDREKGIQARYDENTDALIFPRAVFDYVYELLKEALSQEPTDTWSIKDVADTFKKHGLIREQEPCDDAISRKPCRTCKHGECYNDEWCRCTHYKISGCRVLINNGCEVENCYGIKEPYNDGRE